MLRRSGVPWDLRKVGSTTSCYDDFECGRGYPSGRRCYARIGCEIEEMRQSLRDPSSKGDKAIPGGPTENRSQSG